MNDKLLSACKKYVDRRWHLHPMSEEKRPITPRGYRDATSDFAKVEQWLKDERAACIAVAAGVSNLLVVDVDPRNGGNASFEALLNEVGSSLNSAPRVITPSDGFHLYFALPQGAVKSRTLRDFPGIDFLSSGKSAIVPFSRRVGLEYTWDGDDLERLPQPAPPELLRILESTTSNMRHSPIESGVATQPNQPLNVKFESGQRNVNLARVAGSLRKYGIQEATIRGMLGVLNDMECKPPLDKSEIAQIARSIGSYSPGFDALQFIYAWNREEIAGRELRMAIELARLADDSGKCAPPMSELSMKCRMDKTTMNKIRKLLIGHGVIGKVGRGQCSALYNLKWPSKKPQPSGQNAHQQITIDEDDHTCEPP